MAKKKIDPRIRTLIENNVHQQHRSFFVLVGDHGKDQVPNLHYILSKSQVAKRPNVLWCYKKDLGFSSHRQKRIKQMQKMKQLGIAGQDGTKEEDPFEMFLTGTDIRYTYYSETDKILGSTFGMCVLQDFEALTPNLLARTIETVQGGGMVVLLLKTLTSLKQLYSMVMDVHSRYRTETKHEAVARFNERFLLSLSACDSCLVLDDELNVLPIFSSSKEIVALPSTDREGPKTADELALLKLKQDLAQDDKQKLVAPLVGVAKTLDQAKVVQSFGQLLQDHKNCLRTTVSLTAARGRGKSSALGLALAGAVSNGYDVFMRFILLTLSLAQIRKHLCHGPQPGEPADALRVPLQGARCAGLRGAHGLRRDPVGQRGVQPGRGAGEHLQGGPPADHHVCAAAGRAPGEPGRAGAD